MDWSWQRRHYSVPTTRKTFREVVNLYAARGYHERVEKLFDDFLLRHPEKGSSSDYYRLKGRSLEQANDLRGAESAYRAAVDLGNQLTDRVALGSILWRTAQFKDFVELQIRTFTTFEMERVQTLSTFKQIQELGNHDLLYRFLSRCLEYMVPNQEATDLFLKMLHQQGRYFEGVRVLRRCAENLSGLVKMHIQQEVAEILSKNLGRQAEAIHELEGCLNDEHVPSKIRRTLFVLMVEAERFSEALDLLGAIAEEDRGGVAPSIAQCLMALNRDEEALPWLEHLFEESPLDDNYFLKLATIYTATNDLEKLDELMRRRRQIDGFIPTQYIRIYARLLFEQRADAQEGLELLCLIPLTERTPSDVSLEMACAFSLHPVVLPIHWLQLFKHFSDQRLTADLQESLLSAVKSWQSSLG